MIPKDKVNVAVKSGTAFVCAMCERYWEGKERGMAQCTAREGCGSPLVGDCFHEYKGPVSNLGDYCFVCGEDSKHRIGVNDQIRLIGVCEKHLEWLLKAPSVTDNDGRELKPDFKVGV